MIEIWSSMRMLYKLYQGKNKSGRQRKHKRLLISLCLLLTVLLSGCAEVKGEGKQIVLTNGLGKDEIFRIEKASCTLPEVMVYLTNTKNQYENIYGSQIWETMLGSTTLEQSVKESVLAELAQIKVMNLLAESHEVLLSAEETQLAAQAGREYYASLSEAERAALMVDEKLLVTMYEEYATADKIYQYIIKDINPEISDDEARTITIQHILIKTYTLDGSGKKVPYSESEKAAAYEKAQQILSEARGGEVFESLVSKYNEDSKSTYSFGKGEMDPDFENAAFNLGTDEISDVIETEYGYHIIKCISTFNREETDANKIKIVEQRRNEAFSREYDAFADSLTRDLNTELWESITLLHDTEVTTTEFFQIYDTWFDGVFKQEQDK